MHTGLVCILSEQKQIKEIIKDLMAEFLEDLIYARGIEDKIGLGLFYINYIRPAFSSTDKYGFSPLDFAKHLKSKGILPLEIIANFIKADFPNEAWIERYNVSLN